MFSSYPFLPDFHRRFFGSPAAAETSTELIDRYMTSTEIIEIREGLFRGHHARLLFANDALQSAVALEEGQQHLLLFPYLRCFSWPFSSDRSIESTLLIGGGGFAWPRNFLHTRQEGRIDVVEVSSVMISISRRYFFLDDLLASPRFTLFEKDGFSYLLSCPHRYDLILCDAFTGKKENSSLISSNGITLIKAHLSENGIFMSNYITSLTGLHSRPGHSAKKLFETGFRNTSLIQADDTRDPSQLQNCILMASDGEL
jgi:spermidine synthase